MTSLKLAYLNLIRRKVPSLIALIAIAVSVACSGMLLRLYLLSESRFSTMAQGGDAVVGAKAGGTEILLGSLNLEGPYPDFLPQKLFESLRSQQTVMFEDGEKSQPRYLREVIPFLYCAKFKDFRIIGTDETFLHRPEGDNSPVLAQGKWAAEPDEVILGAEVASAESLKVGDGISVTPWGPGETSGSPVNLKVSGILKSQGTAWDRALYTNLTQARDMLKKVPLGGSTIWNTDVLNYFLVYLQPQGFESLKNLINKRTVGQVIQVAQERERLERLTGTGRRLGLMITAFIMLLGGLSVAAMMITRFEAMSVQLAVLRAIGYSKREVAGWFLWEGILLGAIACVMGAIMDGILFPILKVMMGSALPQLEWIHSPLYQSSPVWGVAFLATVLAVFIPLTRLYRQDVHDSLRGL